MPVDNSPSAPPAPPLLLPAATPLKTTLHNKSAVNSAALFLKSSSVRETRSSMQRGVGVLPPVVAVWTEDDVQKWLEQTGLPSLKESFRMNNVNGDTLLSLSREHFEEDLNVRDRHVLDQLLAAHVMLFDELEVRDWSVDQVAAFVSSIGFRHYATMMREACIDGFGLVSLSLNEMKSAVGIASLGHRRKIRGAIDSILRRQRPKKGATTVGARPASATKATSERAASLSSPFDNDSQSESSLNLTSVAHNSRSLQKAEEQLSMLSSQAAKALSKLEQCERRVHLLRQQLPRPDSEGAALAKAKVKVLPGGLVKGDSSGECTFSPNIAPNSRRIIHETRRNNSSFNERMESYLQRKRHNISEISKEVSHAVTGVGQKDLRKRQEAATFFHEVLGWDVVKGVSPSEIERVLQSPQNFGIKITEEEKASVRKLKGGDQLMALFNLFCIQDFINRQMADVNIRRTHHVASKAAEEEEEQMKRVTVALEYLKERFGWMEVTEEAIDNVIDNSESIELGLDDRCKQAVRHAVGQEKAVVFAYQLRKVDFLSFAAEKERQRLQKIAHMRSEAINETESIVQPSKVIGEEDLEQFMTRMQQHVDRSKHNLNSLFEEVISSVEKDCTFKPSLEPTRAVNEALLQKRASSLGFEGSVEQVRQHLDSKLSSMMPQPKSPSFLAKSQFKAKKTGAAPQTPSDSPSQNDFRQRPNTSATTTTSGIPIGARTHGSGDTVHDILDPDPKLHALMPFAQYAKLQLLSPNTPSPSKVLASPKPSSGQRPHSSAGKGKR